MFAYPGGSGPRGLWGFGAGRLHAHRRLPRDLVGPEPHLAARTTSRARGCSSTAAPAGHRRNPPTGPAGYFKEG